MKLWTHLRIDSKLAHHLLNTTILPLDCDLQLLLTDSLTSRSGVKHLTDAISDQVKIWISGDRSVFRTGQILPDGSDMLMDSRNIHINLRIMWIFRKKKKNCLLNNMIGTKNIMNENARVLL